MVTVMPTCEADSWVDSWRKEARVGLAAASPCSIACCTVVWSSATKANSAATKTAVPMVNPTPARTSNHSVIVLTS